MEYKIYICKKHRPRKDSTPELIVGGKFIIYDGLRSKVIQHTNTGVTITEYASKLYIKEYFELIDENREHKLNLLLNGI